MSDMAEDRVYDADLEGSEAFVAAGVGVVRVEVAGERIGGFGIEFRCDPRDVAAYETVLVATTEDVLVSEDGSFEPTGFGPATAVGYHDGRAVAAGEGGRVAVLDDGSWDELDDLGTDVRAIDGDLLATADGIFRDVGGGLEHVGLEDVRDVSATGVPLAATADGLYELGNGWLDVLDGDFQVVGSRGGGAHAATEETLYERCDGEWSVVDLPMEEPVADVAYGDCPYAVTAEGTLLTGDGEWRPHPLGVRDVVGIAVRHE